MPMHAFARSSEVPASRLPTFSVIIPCYNYGHYLPVCLRSVLEQAGADVEALIIDDASPDGSGQIACQLAEADRRVRAVVHRENRGHIATFNEGLAEIGGDFCLLLSADDVLTPGALARAAELFTAHPEVGMVYGRRIRLLGASLPEPQLTGRGWTIWSGRQWLTRVCRLGTNVVASPEVVLRTQVQKKIGPHRSDLPYSSDLEMWLRAAVVADVGRLNGVDQAYYREHPGSMSQSQVYSVPLGDLKARRAAFQVALEGLDGGDALRARALRSIAGDALDLATKLQQQLAPRGAVQEITEFAVETWPDAAKTFRYKAIRLRQGLLDSHGLGALTFADRTACGVWRRAQRYRKERWLKEVASIPAAR
jgi:glycosyl transferase family 2